jgi:UDPglucose 6-dehydrogenase
VVAALVRRGARVVAHDPVAMDEARRVFAMDAAQLEFAPTPNDALAGADALIIVTEWRHFRSPDFARMKQLLKQPVVFDGRNLFNPHTVRSAGIEYHPIGRSMKAPALAVAATNLVMEEII